MNIDLTKPLQLSDGTPVTYVLPSHPSRKGHVVAVAKGHTVSAGGWTYREGSQMEFGSETLMHILSNLTLQNVPVKMFDPTKPIQTRDGRKARILATDLNDSMNFPLVVAVTGTNGYEFVYTYREGGKVMVDIERDDDLFNVPETKTVYVSMHQNPNGNGIVGNQYALRPAHVLGMGLLKLTLEGDKIKEVELAS